MTSLEYYIEQVKQFISMLTDDIKSGYGTIVTQTKLAVYREVLKHLEEIGQEQSYNSIKTELNGDAISRQAVIDEDSRITHRIKLIADTFLGGTYAGHMCNCGNIPMIL